MNKKMYLLAAMLLSGGAYGDALPPLQYVDGSPACPRDVDIGNIDTATGGVTYLIRADRVNDLRANWSRAENGARYSLQSVYGAIAPPESAIFPAFSGPDTSAAVFGTSVVLAYQLQSGTSVQNVQRQVNLIDTFSMTAGVHLLKFGVDYRRMQPTNAPASYRCTARRCRSHARSRRPSAR